MEFTANGSNLPGQELISASDHVSSETQAGHARCIVSAKTYNDIIVQGAHDGKVSPFEPSKASLEQNPGLAHALKRLADFDYFSEVMKVDVGQQYMRHGRSHSVQLAPPNIEYNKICPSPSWLSETMDNATTRSFETRDRGESMYHTEGRRCSAPAGTHREWLSSEKRTSATDAEVEEPQSDIEPMDYQVDVGVIRDLLSIAQTLEEQALGIRQAAQIKIEGLLNNFNDPKNIDGMIIQDSMDYHAPEIA